MGDPLDFYDAIITVGQALVKGQAGPWASWHQSLIHGYILINKAIEVMQTNRTIYECGLRRI